MKLQMLFAAPALLFASSLHAQVGAAAAAGVTAAAPHIVSAVPAILTGAVSSASAHAGQAVLAKLANPAALSDGTRLPPGTQLLGHLTQVQSLAKGSGKSSLGMVFDHFKSPGGAQKELGLSTLQSLNSSGQSAQQQAPPQQSSQSGNPVSGLLGGVTDTVGSTVNAVGGAATGLVGTVTSLPGVLLNSTGTLVAKGRDVQVPAGTQVTIGASASASAQ